MKQFTKTIIAVSPKVQRSTFGNWCWFFIEDRTYNYDFKIVRGQIYKGELGKRKDVRLYVLFRYEMRKRVKALFYIKKRPYFEKNMKTSKKKEGELTCD